MERIIFYSFGFLAAFLICVAITRAIFSIPAFLKYQKANTVLLMKIARAQGVPEDEIQLVSNFIQTNPKAPVHVNDDYSIHLLDNQSLTPETK